MTESPTFMLDRDYGKFTIKDRASLLRQLYKRLFLIIDACFTGYFLIADERLNLYDIKTRLIIEKILFSEDSGLIHNLCERYKRPFKSLYEISKKEIAGGRMAG